jgi:hypothetical protein
MTFLTFLALLVKSAVKGVFWFIKICFKLFWWILKAVWWLISGVFKLIFKIFDRD